MSNKISFARKTETSHQSIKEKTKIWTLRFIKFNIIGVIVFLVGTVLYSAFFNMLGFWTWLLANAFGSILQFSLISYFNTKQKGQMFVDCSDKGQAEK